MTDHREVEEMFARIQGMPGGGQEHRDVVDEVTIELVRHSKQLEKTDTEEPQMSPLLQQLMNDG